MEEGEIKSLLRRNLELTRENNKLLKKIRRNGFIANIMRIIWWGIIFGIPLFLYYYVFQPYLIELNNAYQEVQNGVTGAQNLFSDIPILSGIFDRFIDTKEIVQPHTGGE